MAKTINVESQEERLKCRCCGSNQLIFSSVFQEGNKPNEILQEVWCNGCNTGWYEVYTYSHREEIG